MWSKLDFKPTVTWVDQENLRRRQLYCKYSELVRTDYDSYRRAVENSQSNRITSDWLRCVKWIWAEREYLQRLVRRGVEVANDVTRYINDMIAYHRVEKKAVIEGYERSWPTDRRTFQLSFSGLVSGPEPIRKVLVSPPAPTWPCPLLLPLFPHVFSRTSPVASSVVIESPHTPICL
ncbi:uncharacterized protein BDR25DRAFT_361574 [Lindgomyces ingoldianus]|uniref:Uncharacterized protein n=1 Tax=Lindgomyces ingoldianus TaxID=673940 RepID=A0ACB6QEC7_9PLEO|nr:uncharacterized protein BDR25DRAFT_361574 [Lindgomyces ingoldianus]KAF2464495.1 hypothetical protein BDR25DRAFT_361574 [Lindgomyces ingoldianus]